MSKRKILLCSAEDIIVLSDLMDECSWTPVEPGGDDGYSVADFFSADPCEEYADRDAAIARLRATYLGRDASGIGLVLPT